MSTRREKLKAMYPGATDDDAAGILDFWNTRSAVNGFQRNAHAQRMAIQLMRQYPGLEGAVGRPGDTPATILFRALEMVGDDSKTKEVARLMGGNGSESRPMVLAHVAQALGVADGQTLDRDFLAPVRNAVMSDALTLRRMDGELRDRQAAERAEKLSPPIDERAMEKVRDAFGRRALLGNLLDDAQRAAPPKARMDDPGSERQVDLLRAWAAVHGEEPNVDPRSNGAKLWAKSAGLEKELNDMAVAEEVAHSDAIKNSVNRQREFSRTIEDGLQRTPIGAATRALAGDEVKADVTRIENQFAEEGE